MKEILLGKYNFYKANLHSHSKISDGCLTPKAMVKAYKENGYSILSITDHNKFVNHNDLSTEDFLLINGVEINIDKKDEYRCTYHLNLFATDKNTKELFKYSDEYSVDNINKIIDAANSNNFLVQYNHPRWSHQYVDDFKDLKNLWGFEIYNGGTELEQLSGLGDFEYETYGRLNQDNDIFPVASSDDDNHNRYGHKDEPLCDSFLGFNMIDSKSLDYEDVIDAMKQRNMYASMGPLIKKLERNGNIISIATSEVKAIILLDQRRKRVTIRDNESKLTKAKMKLPDGAKWFRIEIVDKEGKKAFTSIYRV